MTSVSIVIPAFNHYDLLHQVLFDIYKNCNSVNEVVVVNDASTETDVITGLDWWKHGGMLPVREIRSQTNKGFLLSANVGLMKATGDIKILLSTDVRVKGDLVQAVSLALKENPKRLVGGIIYSQDTGWNKFGKKIFPYVEGWLLATIADGWEALGYLDAIYVPNDFEDVDLSTKALSMGYELVTVPEGTAIHMGGGSIGYSPEREALTKINQRKFKDKWMS